VATLCCVRAVMVLHWWQTADSQPQAKGHLVELHMLSGMDWAGIQSSLHCSKNHGIARLTQHLQTDLQKLSAQNARGCPPPPPPRRAFHVFWSCLDRPKRLQAIGSAVWAVAPHPNRSYYPCSSPEQFRLIALMCLASRQGLPMCCDRVTVFLDEGYSVQAASNALGFKLHPPDLQPTHAASEPTHTQVGICRPAEEGGARLEHVMEGSDSLGHRTAASSFEGGGQSGDSHTGEAARSAGDESFGCGESWNRHVSL